MRKITQYITLKRLVRVILGMGIVWGIFTGVIGVIAHLYGTGQPTPDYTEFPVGDVIVVLGSGLRRDGSAGDALARRSIWAARLWVEGYAPYVLCTGGISEHQERSEAAACREILISRGVDADVIFLEEASRSTEENTLYSLPIFEANGWQSAVVVTDAFHALRASWIFTDYDIAHISQPVPSSWVRWWWYLQLLGRETIALQWQAVKNALNLPVTHVSLG